MMGAGVKDECPEFLGFVAPAPRIILEGFTAQ